MPEMTLSEAAKWAGVTRATIHKALRGGRLSGRKDDAGEWRIDPAELERVYQPDKAVDVSRYSAVSSGDTAELIAAKDRELALMREMLVEVRTQRDDAIEQRNKAMDLADLHTRLLTHQQEQKALPPTRPRLRLGWFRRSPDG